MSCLTKWYVIVLKVTKRYSRNKSPCHHTIALHRRRHVSHERFEYALLRSTQIIVVVLTDAREVDDEAIGVDHDLFIEKMSGRMIKLMAERGFVAGE